MSLEADYLDRIDAMVPQAASELGTPSLQAALNFAVRQYSRLRPRVRVADYDGDGSTYDFDLPSDWVEGFSAIKAVEFPAGEKDPTYLKPDWWLLYRGTAGKVLRLLTTPSSGESVRITYIIPHTLSGTANTTYENDFDAICALAAAYLCESLKAKFAGYHEPTLMADVVNYRTKSREFGEAAAAFRAQFALHFGMGPRDIVPAALGYAELEPQSTLDIDEVAR